MTPHLIRSSFTKKRSITPKSWSFEDRARLKKVAVSAIGKSQLRVQGKTFRADCSGTVRAIYAKSRLPLGGIFKTKNDNDVKTIYRYIKKYGKIFSKNPEPGDLVFFHNTYDRSRNGRMNDPLTHVGIVENVEGETISFVHHLGRSIIRSKMSLHSPKKTFDPNSSHRLNHILRRAQGNYRAYTAAELFAGFGRI